MLIPFVFIIVVLTSKITLIIVIIIIIVIFDLPLCLSDFVDKRGSKVKNTSKEDLEKFYSLSDESEEGTFMLHELHYCALNNRDLCSFIVKCTCLPPTYCTVSLVCIFYSVWLPTSGLFDVLARFIRRQESCTFSVFDLVSLT